MHNSNFRSRTWLPPVRTSVAEPLAFEDLRHTHAAMLVAKGEDPEVLQLRLGHPSGPNDRGRLWTPIDANFLDAFGGYLALRASAYFPAISTETR